MTYQYDTIDKLKAAQDRGAVIRCDQLDGLAWMTAEELGLDRFEFDSSLDDYAVMRDPMFPDGPSGRVEWSLYTPECGPVWLGGAPCLKVRTNTLLDGVLVSWYVRNETANTYVPRAKWPSRLSFSPPCTNPAETSTQAVDVITQSTDARITELEAQLAKSMKVVRAALIAHHYGHRLDAWTLEALKDNGFLEG